MGEIEISGGKNAALPILAATLLLSGAARLSSVPHVADIRTMRKLLTAMGARIEEDNGALAVSVPAIKNCEAPYELVKTMRASILVLGPLLARCHEARVALPGGCAIGVRPIDLHLSGLTQLGAQIRAEHGMICAQAKKLKGATICFEKSTVTGTENLMMAATLAEGTTRLQNVAREPEIVDLAGFLNQCGARISGAGTAEIAIEGVSSLSQTAYTIMPDRIETGTFMVAAAITQGELTLRNSCPDHLAVVIAALRKMGTTIATGKGWIRVKGTARRAMDLVTGPYPAFPTDMQAPMMVLLAVSPGLSRMTETIFESRFTHAAELRRMGAKIYIEGAHAIIEGVPSLVGAPVMASDLRASSSLILAGLVAQGETEISRVYHLDRGYERLEEKLSAVGANIKRVSAKG